MVFKDLRKIIKKNFSQMKSHENTKTSKVDHQPKKGNVEIITLKKKKPLIRKSLRHILPKDFDFLGIVRDQYSDKLIVKEDQNRKVSAEKFKVLDFRPESEAPSPSRQLRSDINIVQHRKIYRNQSIELVQPKTYERVKPIDPEETKHQASIKEQNTLDLQSSSLKNLSNLNNNNRDIFIEDCSDSEENFPEKISVEIKLETSESKEALNELDSSYDPDNGVFLNLLDGEKPPPVDQNAREKSGSDNDKESPTNALKSPIKTESQKNEQITTKSKAETWAALAAEDQLFAQYLSFRADVMLQALCSHGDLRDSSEFSEENSTEYLEKSESSSKMTNKKQVCLKCGRIFSKKKPENKFETSEEDSQSKGPSVLDLARIESELQKIFHEKDRSGKLSRTKKRNNDFNKIYSNDIEPSSDELFFTPENSLKNYDKRSHERLRLCQPQKPSYEGSHKDFGKNSVKERKSGDKSLSEKSNNTYNIVILQSPKFESNVYNGHTNIQNNYHGSSQQPDKSVNVLKTNGGQSVVPKFSEQQRPETDQEIDETGMESGKSNSKNSKQKKTKQRKNNYQEYLQRCREGVALGPRMKKLPPKSWVLNSSSASSFSDMAYLPKVEVVKIRPDRNLKKPSLSRKSTDTVSSRASVQTTRLTSSERKMDKFDFSTIKESTPKENTSKTKQVKFASSGTNRSSEFFNQQQKKPVFYDLAKKNSGKPSCYIHNGTESERFSNGFLPKTKSSREDSYHQMQKLSSTFQKRSNNSLDSRSNFQKSKRGRQDFASAFDYYRAKSMQ